MLSSAMGSHSQVSESDLLSYNQPGLFRYLHQTPPLLKIQPDTIQSYHWKPCQATKMTSSDSVSSVTRNPYWGHPHRFSEVFIALSFHTGSHIWLYLPTFSSPLTTHLILPFLPIPIPSLPIKSILFLLPRLSMLPHRALLFT